jgi:hypothetical protein
LLDGPGLHRLRRGVSLGRGPTPRGAERLGLLARYLLLRRAVKALELEVLADGVVQHSHRRRD